MAANQYASFTILQETSEKNIKYQKKLMQLTWTENLKNMLFEWLHNKIKITPNAKKVRIE